MAMAAAGGSTFAVAASEEFWAAAGAAKPTTSRRAAQIAGRCFGLELGIAIARLRERGCASLFRV